MISSDAHRTGARATYVCSGINTLEDHGLGHEHEQQLAMKRETTFVYAINFSLVRWDQLACLAVAAAASPVDE